METLRIKFEYKNKKHVLEAHLTDDLNSIINDDENQATEIVDGIGEELGIWSIYFDRHKVQADFICYVDDNGIEHKNLQPVEVFLMDEHGVYINDCRIPFVVESVE